jgi:HEAT repeat protein
MGHDDDRAVAALIALSADADPGVRDWATFSLGAQIERDSVELREALAARLGDPNKEARGEAIAGLARRGDPRALEAALAVAAGPDGRSPTLDEAIVLLGRTTGDPRLVEHLERLREDPRFAEEHGEDLERALARCRLGPPAAP